MFLKKEETDQKKEETDQKYWESPQKYWEIPRKYLIKIKRKWIYNFGFRLFLIRFSVEAFPCHQLKIDR